jgi:cytochrome P450
MLGETHGTMPSNDEWSYRRKVLSTSLYKEKLLKMIDIMKECTLSVSEEWSKLKTVNLVQEASNLQMRVTLSCLFGRKYQHATVDQS